MDAVEIDGDGRGMSVLPKYVEIQKDGWCLYSAILEGFSGVPRISEDPSGRRRYARMLAYILGQFMIDAINNTSPEAREEILKHWR